MSKPADIQKALDLIANEGKTWAEAAELAGVSESTISRALRRAPREECPTCGKLWRPSKQREGE